MRSWLNFSDIRPLQPTGISSLSAAAAAASAGVWGVLRDRGEELLSHAGHAHKRCFPAGGGFLHWYLPGKEKFCHTLSAGVCIRQLVYPKMQLINSLLSTQPWNQCKLMQWAQLCEVTGVVSASCRHTHHVLTIRPTDAGHLHHDVHGDDLGLYQKQRIALLISFILRTAQTIWKKKCKTSCILIEPWSANVYAESARVNTKSRERIKTYRTWGVNERGKAVLTLDANISSPYTVSKSASVQLSLISAQRCCFCVQEYVQWKME